MMKKVLVLIFILLMLTNFSFAERPNQEVLKKIDVYNKPGLAKDDFIFVFEIQAYIDETETGNIYFLDLDEERDNGIWADVKKTLEDNSVVDPSDLRDLSFEQYKINFGKLDFEILDRESDGDLDVLYEFDGDNIDCFPIFGIGSFNLRQKVFSYCDDKEIPDNKGLAMAKHTKLTSYTGTETFTIVYGTKSKVEKLEGKGLSEITTILTGPQLGLIKLEKKLDPDPAPGLMDRATGVASDVGAAIFGAVGDVKDSVVNRFYDWKYGPTNFSWDNPDEKDTILLSWEPISNEAVKGYVVKREDISKAPREIKYYGVESTKNVYIFNSGEFEQDVTYDFTLFSSIANLPRTGELPEAAILSLGEDLKQGKPQIRVEVTSEETDVVLENLKIRVIVEGNTYIPDAATKEIYLPYKENIAVPVCLTGIQAGLEGQSVVHQTQAVDELAPEFLPDDCRVSGAVRGEIADSAAIFAREGHERESLV